MSNAIQRSGGDAASGLVPANMDEAIRLADMMANSTLVPDHLRNKAGDCFMVIEQSTRWRMSPFAVAPCTSVIHGKLMYEGKLVAAAVNNSGLLSRRLNCRYEGQGDDREATVFGTLKGEDEPREIKIMLRDARTDNGTWQKQPDQQLFYAGARVWARRHAPEVMLGVYTPEEFDTGGEPPAERNITPEARQPEALPNYSEEAFNQHFGSWAKAIENGKKTPEEVIQTVETKGVLSDDQKQAIRNCAATQTEDE